MRRLLLLPALWLAGCSLAVSARGLIRPLGEGVEIAAPNGKTRPLVLAGESELLRRAEGSLVEVEGTLRAGAIEVEGFRFVEGPHGLAAYVGTLRSDARRVWLEVPGGGPPLTLQLGFAPLPDDAPGAVVLVEGAAIGGDTLAVVGVRVLQPARPPR